MKKRHLFLPILIVFITGNLSAAGWATQDGTLEYINIESDLVRIKFTATDSQDPDSCGNPGYVILKDDTKQGDRQYSALLAAQMAGTSVKLYTSGCVTRGSEDYPKLISVYLQD